MTATDPTTFVNSVYEGRGERVIIDARLEEAVTVNAYLFQADYTDVPPIEIIVNPEFGSVQASSTEASIYAPIIGRLPFALRACLKVIWLNGGEGHYSFGTGGLMIHTGNGQGYIDGDSIEEILAHVASHACLDPQYFPSLEWTQAQTEDGGYISTSALNYPTEDATESFLAYLAYRYRRDRISAETAQKIIETIPNRIAFYDNMHLDLRPLIDSEFQINAGLNDSWYNPATDGQGFFITVYPDLGMMFVSWFTFDVERPPPGNTAILGEPGHRWLTAFGPYDGDTANLDIEVTRGGVFDKAQPPATTESGYGTMTVEFADCTAGLVSYEIPSLGLQGQIPIERIALDNVTLCGTLAVQNQ